MALPTSWWRCWAIRAGMHARRSAWRCCPRMPRLRSKASSRSPDAMAGLDWLIARPVAHRGLHDAQKGVIENTPSAFLAAIAGGYGIECDLQVSADGEAMVHHDDVLGRLTDGTGRLKTVAAAALKRVGLNTTRDRMITLGQTCDRAAEVLSGYRGRAALMSFYPEQTAALHAMAPLLPRGIVAERRYPRLDGLY